MSSIQVLVKLVVKKDGKIFIASKKDGDGHVFELPGGRIKNFEQPEDIAQKVLEKELGVRDEYRLRLRDILNYGESLEVERRSLVIIFDVDIFGEQKIALGERYHKYQWKNIGNVNYGELDDLSGMILRIEDTSGVFSVGNEVKASSADLTIFSDGGSRGNPGPSASACVLVKDGQVVTQGGEYIGITTNNQAEYRGVYLGLLKARELGFKDVLCKIDNMMVVNQMKGVYSVKNRDLWPIHDKMRELVADFDKVSFMHIKREFNVASDSLVNEILDEHAKNNV